MEQHDPYIRRARYVRTIDGDTVQLVIDLGWHASVEVHTRLLNVDTPERGQECWRASKEFTAGWLDYHSSYPATQSGRVVEWPLIIRSEKADAFGRYLVEIRNLAGESLNDELRRRWPSALVGLEQGDAS